MILTHKISLSLDRRGDRPCIDAVQGDTARSVEISLLDNGSPWLVPERTTAVIRYRRIQGGTGGVYDTLESGAPAYSMGESSVTVQLLPQVLAVAGPVELQVTLCKDGAELTCFSILIHVQGNLSDAEAEEGYVNLRGYIQDMVESMNLAKRDQTVHFVQGSSASTAGTWLGDCPDIHTYYEGLMVAYRTANAGGHNGTTLNINGLGAVNVKRNGLSQDITYYYSANTVLFLTYVLVGETPYWQMADVWFADTDKKTSSGASRGQKLFLIGAKSVNSEGVTTYTNESCYVGTDNCLYSGRKKVATVDDLPASAPDSVPDYVRTEAQRLAKVVQSRQNENTISFVLGADIHARLGLTGSPNSEQMLQSTLHAAQAMEIVANQVHLDFAGLLGGYISDTGETTEQAMEMFRTIREYFCPAFRGLPQFWCKGDQDGLYGDELEEQLTDQAVFSVIGIHNSGAIFDGTNKVSGYCHRDFEEWKLRIICMNTAENEENGADAQQIAWLRDVLDVQPDWKVIVLSHCPLDRWGTLPALYQTVEEFADNILCNIHGYTHNYVTGVVGNTAIPRLAIPNIDFYHPNIYSQYEESTSYQKTADSAQDTAFCVITIDLATNQLYADRYGAGYDRMLNLNTPG